MRVEVRFLKDDPNSRIISEDVEVVLDGTPEIVERLKKLIDEYLVNLEWEKL